MSRLASVALLLLVPAALLAQRHSGGHSRASGRGVPCGRSYISASKTCHIGTADVPASSAPDPGPRQSSDTAAGANNYLARAYRQVTPVTTPANVETTLDRAARERCAADSGATATDPHRGRAPECLRAASAQPVATGAPPDSALLTLQGQRRSATVPLILRRGPAEFAPVLVEVPPGSVVEINSCTTDGGVWCLATFDAHTGFISRQRLTGDGTSVVGVLVEEPPRPASAYAARAPRARVRTLGGGAVRGGHPGYYVGPRGGCYTYSASGRKRYVDHSYCR